MNKLKVLLRSPLLTASGYGHHARTIFRALRKYEHVFDIYLEATNWGSTGWVCEDTEERRYIDELLAKTHIYSQQGGQFDIFLHNTIPNEFQKRAPVSIGMTAGIECTKIVPEWINPSNQMDKVICVSNHAKFALDTTTYQATNNQTGQPAIARVFSPIDVVGYPALPVEPKKMELDLKYDFNFLVVSAWGIRKNMENTIKWFVEEFRNKEVGLVVKTNTINGSIIDRAHTENRLKELLRNHQDRKCSVHLLHGDLNDEEMAGVYTNPKIKAIVNIAHGEGFGLPLFEAGYYGLPIVSIAWGGQNDFMFVPIKDKKGKIKETFCGTEVSYELKPVQDQAVQELRGMVIPDGMWAYAKEVEYKKKLREVYNNHGACKKKAKLLKEKILKDFEADKVYDQLALSIYEYADLYDKVVDVGQMIVEENTIPEMKEVVVYG